MLLRVSRCYGRSLTEATGGPTPSSMAAPTGILRPFATSWQSLASRIDLKVVHVLERPPLGWLGETGRVGLELLERHLPRSGRRVCFVCGPRDLMDAVEGALAALGVHVEDIHAERLELG